MAETPKTVTLTVDVRLPDGSRVEHIADLVSEETSRQRASARRWRRTAEENRDEAMRLRLIIAKARPWVAATADDRYAREALRILDEADES